MNTSTQLPVPKRLDWLLQLLPLLFAAYVWSGLLATDFKTDDFYHMYTMANYGFARFVLTPHGGHVLLLRNAIFYLLFQIAGLHPMPYFASVLATHLLATRFLFLAISRMTSNSLLACVGALLWSTAPIQAGSLEWYSVYGHVLSTAILFWILADVSRLAMDREQPTRKRVLSWYAAAVAGAMTFGTGLPVAMLLGPVVFLMLPPSRERRSVFAIAATSLLVIPLVFLLLHRVYAALWNNDQDQATTILSSAWDYGSGSVEMFRWLVLWGANSVLFPGQQYGSGEYPAQALAIGTLGLAIPIAYVLAPQATRNRLLAVAMLLGATYSTIAIARAYVIQVFHGTALWAASFPRYHYLGTGLIVMATALVFHTFLERGKWTRAVSAVAAAAWLVWLLTDAARPIEPTSYPDPRPEIARVLATVRNAVTAAAPGASVVIPNKRFNALGGPLVPGSAETGLFPGWGAVFILATTSNVVDGRQVFFRENDSHALAVLRADPNSRSASLFVGPSEVPASKLR